MVQSLQRTKHFHELASEELSTIISTCEQAIADGSAKIEDYEAFVLCQQELMRRTWAA